jgi:hypothetical protein
MQFIKKNYEKILLGLVMVGLVAVAMFSIFLVSNERQKQEERRTQIFSQSVKPLPAPDLGGADALLKRGQASFAVNLSDNTNKLFNPVRWQKGSDGRLIRNPAGTDPEKVEITRILPLYTIIALDSVSVSDTGVRYVISVEQQAAARPNRRGKTPFYLSVGDKKEYGEKKDTFTLREVRGDTNTVAAELVLDLSDSDKPIVISGKDKPFKRVDGYLADLRYVPEDRRFVGRRVGDRIIIAGEDYNIVAITESEVVLSAKSNQKKWTIKYSAAP